MPPGYRSAFEGKQGPDRHHVAGHQHIQVSFKTSWQVTDATVAADVGIISQASQTAVQAERLSFTVALAFRT
jgi:hypothetical protein